VAKLCNGSTRAGYGSRRAVAVALATAALASPAGALGADLNQGVYKAGPGEVNGLTVTYDPGADTYTYTDTGAAIADGDGGGLCSVAGNIGTCPRSALPGGSSVTVYLGDGDDSATINDAVPSPLVIAQMVGQDGADRLIYNGSARAALLGDVGLDGSPPSPSAGNGGDNDYMQGGSGENQMYSSFGNFGNFLDLGLGAGNDTFVGGPGIDFIGGGDGNDAINSGDGNDTLSGGPGDDQIEGGAGDDILVGALGESADVPDFGLVPASNGADVISMGPGADLTTSLEARDAPNALDQVSCGGDQDNTAWVGPGDTLSTDCENTATFVHCPPGGAACKGTAVVTVGGGSGSSAVAARQGKRMKQARKKKVALGQEKFKIRAGTGRAVGIEFKAKAVRRALKKRRTVPAQIVSKAKRAGKSKTAFTLRKG
jgi:Ca2+-binding RTX toxin-like protein